jgi:hypothetical protein
MRMHVSPSKVPKCTCYAMHFQAHEFIKLRVQPTRPDDAQGIQT